MVTSRERPARPRLALVLSGGGARGAYEAGTLGYIFEEIPKRSCSCSLPAIWATKPHSALRTSPVPTGHANGSAEAWFGISVGERSVKLICSRTCSSIAASRNT